MSWLPNNTHLPCVCVGGENGECLYLHYYPHITCITIMVVVGVAIVQYSLSIATEINSELYIGSMYIICAT